MQDRGQITGIMSPLLEKWRLSKVLQHINGNKILDYGCGCGKLASNLEDKEYVGVDINENIIETARNTYVKHNNTRFYTLKEFEKVESEFDCIVLSAIIEHLENPIEKIIQFKKMLSKEGIIIITTPTSQANQILEVGAHFRLFSKEAVDEHDELLDKNDFIQISKISSLILEKYERFELGLNQLVVYRNV